MRKISAIYIYPVKSLPGISMQHAVTERRGLQNDRRWMLVDETGKFITVRNERKLLHFEMHPLENGWKIVWENDSIEIPFVLEEGPSFRVTIWDDEVNAIRGEMGWNDWFSQILGYPCSLVFMPASGHRPVNPEWNPGSEEVSFADGYPYLIVNEESLRETERKSGQALSILRFRPNLVIQGGEAHEELYYRNLRAGNAAFHALKPCVRCVVTTLDPETGEQGTEPLKTLAAQKVDGKVVFGQHATLAKVGTISVGDNVEVTRWKDSPYGPL